MAGKKPIDERVRETAEEFRDPEIEYQLVAYLTRSNPNGCGSMEKNWFADILLQDVFTIVNDLRITLTKAMLSNELKKRGMIGKNEEGLYEEVVDHLFEIDVSGFNDKNSRHMMQQVLELSETRQILVGCGEIIASMKQFKLGDAKRKLSVLGRPVGLTDHTNSGYYLDDYGERVEILEEKIRQADESEDAQVGVPTGIYRFDKQVGGLMRKEFGIVAGVTGVGKTAALISFGLHAWLHGHDVMMVSGEMAKELVAFRVDSYLTRIHGMKFRTAELTDKDYKEWARTIEYYQTKMKNFLYIATYHRNFTVENIEQDMVRLQEETGRKAGVVCMDYINIMDPVRRGRSDWKDQADAVWDFKGFIAENDLVGWTAGQVTDEAYDKELYDASDLKYARALSECAPVIAGLIRTEKDIVENRMKLQIIKMRNAEPPRKPIALTPNLSIMRIHEELREMKTLKGRQGDTIEDVKRKTRTVRPKKTLHGR